MAWESDGIASSNATAASRKVRVVFILLPDFL
jgi:hypothetical protein